MKSERGITLPALVAYITVFVMIITIMTIISSYFYRNVNKIKDLDKYILEYNKFSMFFIADVKKNADIKSITANSLEFLDGTIYIYENNAIYRNNEKIAKYIKNFTFTLLDYTADSFTKKIINVNTTIGDDDNQITRNIDFVLKYW